MWRKIFKPRVAILALVVTFTVGEACRMRLQFSFAHIVTAQSLNSQSLSSTRYVIASQKVLAMLSYPK